jgi:hypothetical protein
MNEQQAQVVEPASLPPLDPSDFASWLGHAWRSATASQKEALTTLANAMGCPLPFARLRRTKRAPLKSGDAGLTNGATALDDQTRPVATYAKPISPDDEQ